jgi:hypothetical protein
MNEVELWNRRAAWCLTHCAEIEALARKRIERWRLLVKACASNLRALLAAAHQGLDDGPIADLVRRHRGGCLMLAGGVGEGKTTGIAYRCYTGPEIVLWLDAPAVGRADAKAHRATLRAIDDAGLVVLDDVGAAGSTGEYEAPKVIEVLTKLTGSPRPSFASSNLPRFRPRLSDGKLDMRVATFGDVYDGEDHGRLVDRFTMAPNRFVEIPLSATSKRENAVEPPETLPPLEFEAEALISALTRTRNTAQAFTASELRPNAVRFVAGKLGVRSDEALDAKIREHDQARARYMATVEAARAAGGGT